MLHLGLIVYSSLFPIVLVCFFLQFSRLHKSLEALGVHHHHLLLLSRELGVGQSGFLARKLLRQLKVLSLLRSGFVFIFIIFALILIIAKTVVAIHVSITTTSPSRWLSLAVSHNRRAVSDAALSIPEVLLLVLEHEAERFAFEFLVALDHDALEVFIVLDQEDLANDLPLLLVVLGRVASLQEGGLVDAVLSQADLDQVVDQQ
mmetsp:Transcript_20809/g.32106  ORF Transcript_20809/g.32106 Transcript_20809/m.32106 type:complete len:204 (-) Transcript_20809:219-830(-)